MASRLPLTRIGELEVIELPCEGESKGLVLCMHGYGADCYDLADLSRFLDPEQQFDWIFPNGPMKVPIGPHMFGRGWFSIDIMGMQRAIQQGKVHDLEDYIPPELKSSVGKIKTLIDIKKRPWSEIILMGFSQGAMIAMEAALGVSANPKGLVLMSGALINKKVWEERIGNRRGQKFFQSHGTYDPVLPVQGARKLNEMMTKAGFEGGFHEFDGGHEIPQAVLQDIHSFFRSLL